MNRRGFLGLFSLAAVPAVAVGSRSSPAVQVEPNPTRFDFESLHGPDCDCTTGTVSWALGQVMWDSADPIKPLLVVHPARYGSAIEIMRDLDQKVTIWAMPFSEDIDTWFIAWHGRRVGSAGA